jgi:CdiI immunity protein
MTEDHSNEKKKFDPADYPALREFLPAYLHQDFGEEYDSPREAVEGFVSEASGDEILQVKEEWESFRANFAGQPLKQIQIALQRLGSGWMPANEAELRQLDEVLSRAQA